MGANWEPPSSAATVLNIICLNNCSTGGTLSPGSNNAPLNKSSIVNQTVNIPAYSGTAAQWDLGGRVSYEWGFGTRGRTMVDGAATLTAP